MHRDALHFTDSESDGETSDKEKTDQEDDEEYDTALGAVGLNRFAALSDD